MLIKEKEITFQKSCKLVQIKLELNYCFRKVKLLLIFTTKKSFVTRNIKIRCQV